MVVNKIVRYKRSRWSGSVVPGWSSLGTWLGQPRRKTITVSSPLHWDRHLTGGDPWGIQEAPGWERSMTMFSSRTLESIRRGGRQGTGRSGNKSSVRQRSVRSMLPRRRRSWSGSCRGNFVTICGSRKPERWTTGGLKSLIMYLVAYLFFHECVSTKIISTHYSVI